MDMGTLCDDAHKTTTAEDSDEIRVSSQVGKAPSALPGEITELRTPETENGIAGLSGPIAKPLRLRKMPPKQRSGQVNGVQTQKSCPVVKSDKDGKADGYNQGALYVVFVALVIDLLAFTMILPLLPAVLDYYGHHDKGGLYWWLKNFIDSFRALVGAPDTPRWNSVFYGGLIGSMFSFLQFLTAPLIGAASDVYGRKPVLLISMLGIAVSYGLWALSSNFTIFVLARIVGGLTRGNISLSTTIVTDISPPEKRGRGMAMVGVAFSVGFIIGPLIGAYFSKQVRDHDAIFFVYPAVFALLLALIDVLFIFMCFRESLSPAKRAKSLGSGLERAISLINPVALFKFSAVQGASKKDLHSLQRIGIVYFLYLFLYSGLEFTLTFLTHNRFEFDSLQQGKMFFVIGIIMVVVQGGFVRRLKPGKELAYAVRGIMILIPAFIVVGLSFRTLWLFIGLVMYSFASATVVPCLTTVVSTYGTANEKGTVLGIFRSLGALARAVGPVISCTVYWSFGAIWCYAIGGIALIFPLLMLRKLKVHQD